MVGLPEQLQEAILCVEQFTSKELSEMVASGKICDANSLAVFARLTALRLLC